MIRALGLRKSFQSRVAVGDVTFCAEDGAITGLLGANGAGKTTTLRMLGGLFAPDDGTACVDGVDVTRAPVAAQQRMGVLPDAVGLSPRLTAREHVRYFGELRGLGGEILEERIQALAVELDMAGIIDRRARGFSHGERAKVAIARALVHDPQNVVLDEPTNGLDLHATRAMRSVVQKLKASGKCVLFSSHVAQEIAALCDKVAVIAEGRVVVEGSLDGLRRAANREDLEEALMWAINGGAHVG